MNAWVPRTVEERRAFVNIHGYPSEYLVAVCEECRALLGQTSYDARHERECHRCGHRARAKYLKVAPVNQP